MSILLLGSVMHVVGKENRLVNRDGQSAVSPSHHHHTEDQLAETRPAATEAIIIVGYAETDAHTTIGRDDLEDDVEDRKGGGSALKLRRLHDHHEQDGQHDAPHIMRELRSELLPDKVAA